jgi:cytochrome c peroxidase
MRQACKRLRSGSTALAVSLALSCAAAGAPQPSLAMLQSLGPWPPAPQRDPSNHVSGQAQAIELGRRLFRDPRMSPVGYIACVSCHQPDRSFTDHKARAHGLADLPRNTPALTNLNQQRNFGWDGASDRLWLASMRPILDAREFGGSPASVLRMFERDPALAACYARVFRAWPQHDASRTVVNVGKALAAYVETLVTERTPFDAHRDALLRGDAATAGAYPALARRGLALFVGSAGCVACHGGPNFSDGQVHGQGAARLRTPSLRNVATSGPYLHDGRADTLGEAVRHAQPALAAADTEALTAFLQTLTDRHGERRPWRVDDGEPCSP